MPAGFHRHLVCKTLRPMCFFHCDIAEIRFVVDNTDIFWNQRTECNLNNTINLRLLTPHILPCYSLPTKWRSYRDFTLCRPYCCRSKPEHCPCTRVLLSAIASLDRVVAATALTAGRLTSSLTDVTSTDAVQPNLFSRCWCMALKFGQCHQVFC